MTRKRMSVTTTTRTMIRWMSGPTRRAQTTKATTSATVAATTPRELRTG